MKSTEQSYQQQRRASPPVFFLRAADPIPTSGQQYIHIICLRVWGVSGWGLRLRKRKICRGEEITCAEHKSPRKMLFNSEI